MKTILLFVCCFMLSACSESKQSENSVGRYTLTTNSGPAVYRLDSVTGTLDMCRPVGNSNEGYKLECTRELK